MAKGYKAIVSVPGWANALHDGEEGEANKVTSTELAYAYVPLIFRAVRIRCDALVRPRVVVKKKSAKGDGAEAVWPFTTDPKDLLWKTEASLLLKGAAFTEKLLGGASKRVKDLSWVNPLTMQTPKATKEDGKLVYTFAQKNSEAKWTLDDMMYIREFSLTDDIGPGVSAGGVALNDAALIRYMGRSVAKFFETGMMPVTLLQVEGLVDEDEKKRIESFFRRVATGIRNMWKVLALNSSAVEPKVISQPLKDMVIPDLNEQAERAIAHAFGFNPSLFDQSPNRATAMEHRLSLYQDTVEPRGDWLTEQWNRQVFHDMGLVVSLDYSELDIYQEDENDRAGSLSALTSAISTDPKAALFVMTEILGYDLTDKQREAYQALFLREPDGPEEEGSTTMDPQTQDLLKWRKKALKLAEKGRPPACDFSSNFIGEALHESIRTGLVTCVTPQDVKRLFTTASRQQGEIVALLDAIRWEVAAIGKAGG